MKISRWLMIPVLIIIVVQFAQIASAAAVRISWLSNSESDLAGYRVYYGSTSRNYQWYIDAGRTTSTQINNLVNGVTYYFALTAYDTSGNESAFSQEIPAAIPAQGSGSGSGDVPGGTVEPQADSDIDGIPDNVELLWGLDPSDPTDSLFDLDGDGVVNLVEYMAGTDPLDPAVRPATDDILKDVIGEMGAFIDLADINPTGQFTIVPLMAGSPEVEDNVVDLSQPGAYLYNVYDAEGGLIYRLRISVATQLFTTGSFEPGAPLNLKELSMGITIQLRADSILREVPVGIGNPSTEPASAINYDPGKGYEFDLLPYGLALAEPANISVNYDKQDPIVQRYDADENTWKDIPDITVTDGLVSFSTQEFGKFRIYSAAEDSVDGPSSSSGGGGGGGCFISTAGM
ncbi:MAG: fibronectin type III domain-containing protein [Syntrophaceae bacterium]